MGLKIEPTIIDGDVEKKSLYNDGYDDDELVSADDFKGVLDSYDLLGDSEEELESLFDANKLGKVTIDVPAVQKLKAQDVEPEIKLDEKFFESGVTAEEINDEFRKQAEKMLELFEGLCK